MEIEIKIKLEDTDINLLIKSLFEIIKNIPQDSININIEPNAKPPEPPQVVPLVEPNWDTATHNGIANTTIYNPLDNISDSIENEDVYYSENGKSVSKIENEKKNEE